jgi:hypothetical protein
MMAKTSRVFVCLFLAVFLFISLVQVSVFALQEDAEQESPAIETRTAEKVQAAEQEAEKMLESSNEGVEEVIVPAPKDQKEAIGIYIFLVWIWLSIFVLIYVLRLKVIETDRIHQLKFFPEDKK